MCHVLGAWHIQWRWPGVPVFVGSATGKLRWCIWNTIVEILNFDNVVLKPPSLTLRYIMFFALIHEHSRSSSRFPVSLKFWSTVTSPWPLAFARTPMTSVVTSSGVSSCGGTAQASEYPFSELSCPTTCLQGKLVDVWNFLFGVEEVIIEILILGTDVVPDVTTSRFRTCRLYVSVWTD